MTKQSVMKAREKLRKEGFITFVPGSGTNEYPLYTIIDKTDQLSGQLSGLLSGQLSLYKNKDKNNSTSNARKENALSLDKLEKMFQEDETWQKSVLDLLLAKNIMGTTNETLQNYISQFFLYLRASGKNERETNDCKNYFVNWLMNQLSNKRDVNHKTERTNERRTSEVETTSMEDYYQAF